VEPAHAELSVRRQCELLALPRSTCYYEPRGELPENLALMRRIDELFLKWPFLGSRKIADALDVGRKRVQRLMRVMGLVAIAPKPRTTKRCPEHKIYPYLLRNVEVTHPDHVWSTDITYIPLRRDYLYLVAVMDWFSRYVLSWRLSPTLEAGFCVEALREALAVSRPEIFNTDQGSQFTSEAFTSCLESHDVAISMDGRGRALDNVFVERLWRSVKYEEVYMKDYELPEEAKHGLRNYFRFYNHERAHFQSCPSGPNTRSLHSNSTLRTPHSTLPHSAFRIPAFPITRSPSQSPPPQSTNTAARPPPGCPGSTRIPSTATRRRGT
jgi:putative transposase